MFDFFFDFIAQILAFYYSLVPSYGAAIALLTLTVMIVVTPLTFKGTRSMLQMQRLQPELKAIQNKYKGGDRSKMNEELLVFYQENGINPLGGCLPLLVQMPVFLVLFRVFDGITQRVTAAGLTGGWAAGRGSQATSDEALITASDLNFAPQNLPEDSEMYLNLSQSNTMEFFGMDLSRSALEAAGESITGSLPYFGLILVVLVSSLYQQKQMRSRNGSTGQTPQMEMVMKFLPWMLPVFSLSFPMALVVYFVVSNLYRIVQQAYITRSLYGGEDSLGAQAARSRQIAAEADEAANQKGGKSSDGAKKNTKSKSTKSKASGAGRTGKAPSRRGSGGRTTAPGTAQHKKRKR